MSTMQKIKFMTKYNKDYRYHIKFHSIWNLGIDINQCIDAPMHLLFQGINKTLIEYTFNVLVQYQNSKQFKDSVKSLLKQIKSLNCCFYHYRNIMNVINVIDDINISYSLYTFILDFQYFYHFGSKLNL